MGAGCQNQCPTCKCAKKASIIGAGLVGSLWAMYLSKAGYQVDVYERRPDMRLQKMSAGKSINLATSARGWKALDAIGVGDEIRKMAIPVYSRTLHPLDGKISQQPYGKEGEAIYSVSRGALNATLMTLAEKDSKVSFHFNQECIQADTSTGKLVFKSSENQEITEVHADLIFATDGAFSAVRYHGMQRLDQFNFSQQYIPDGYREILLPANNDGSYKLDQETLHIWPRGRFMLIALPNADGSFTCTLFMPFDGHEYCFNALDSQSKVEDFFKEIFPDFYQLHPQVAEEWEKHPLSSLAIIRCFPWRQGRTVLMGDAAHATVPFFGQGMNCGFEDCTVLFELMQEHEENWELILPEYEKRRKPNTDAMQELSLQNYLVMRDRVTDIQYQLIQRLERRLSVMYPENYFPLYSMVSFTNIPYETALKKGNEQEAKIRKMIEEHQLTMETSDAEIDQCLFSFADQIQMA